MVNVLPSEIANNILAREGGYVDDPSDSGGETNFGITQPTYKSYCERMDTEYDASHLKDMTRDEAIAVYTWLYHSYNLDRIDDWRVGDLLFDCCVNHGPTHPIQWVQSVLGLNPDGVLGDDTAQAIAANPKQAYYGIIAKRVVYYAAITQANPQDIKFIKGWEIRIAAFIKEI